MTRSGPGREAGMTLIEILTVMFLIAVVMGGMAISATGVFGARITEGSNQLSAMARYTYNLASLRGKVHRIVIDLDADEYYIEQVELGEECQEILADLKSDERRSLETDAKGLAERNIKGTVVSDMRVRKESLKEGIEFVKVRTSHSKASVDAGKESIYFFPDGTAEKAFVWLTNGDTVHTVVIRPLQGTGVVYKEDLDEKGFDKK